MASPISLSANLVLCQNPFFANFVLRNQRKENRNGKKMRSMRQRAALREAGKPRTQRVQQEMEPQSPANQGARRRQGQEDVRLHPMHQVGRSHQGTLAKPNNRETRPQPSHAGKRAGFLLGGQVSECTIRGSARLLLAGARESRALEVGSQVDSPAGGLDQDRRNPLVRPGKAGLQPSALK